MSPIPVRMSALRRSLFRPVALRQAGTAVAVRGRGCTTHTQSLATLGSQRPSVYRLLPSSLARPSGASTRLPRACSPRKHACANTLNAPPDVGHGRGESKATRSTAALLAASLDPVAQSGPALTTWPRSGRIPANPSVPQRTWQRGSLRMPPMKLPLGLPGPPCVPSA